MSFHWPYLWNGQNSTYLIRLLEIRDSAVKSLVHFWHWVEPQNNETCYSQTAIRKRQGGFLAQSSEVVGRGHSCLCKLRMQARKRGLIILGFQCNHSGLAPLQRYQMEWSLIPLSCEFLKDSLVFLTLKAVEEAVKGVGFFHAVCSYFLVDPHRALSFCEWEALLFHIHHITWEIGPVSFQLLVMALAKWLDCSGPLFYSY